MHSNVEPAAKEKQKDAVDQFIIYNSQLITLGLLVYFSTRFQELVTRNL